MEHNLDMERSRNDQIHQEFERLCSRFHIPVQIVTVHDPDAPTKEIAVENGIHVITLNTAKLPAVEYKIYVGYHVRQILLPRLVLETERLVLRRCRPEDAADCFELLSNEADAYMDCSKAFPSMDDAFYKRFNLFTRRETQYMIALKDTGKVIGAVNVFEDNSRAVEAMEIGYAISPDYRHKGYAFEALSALLDLLQRELYLEIVTAGILPENLASEKLLTKLGFHKEGLRHKAVWHEGLDRPVDLIYYYRD